MSEERASGREPSSREQAASDPFGVAGPGRRVHILFVCLGNICRSPTAEAIMAQLIEQRGLQDEVTLDSAGTGGWHVGESPDRRAAEAAGRRGITLAGAARQVSPKDFERFDLILAMDRSNLAELRRLAPDEQSRQKVRLLREFDPEAKESRARDPKTRAPETQDGDDLDVPDPYYGGPEGFEHVIDLVMTACEGVLDSLGLGEAARR